MSQQDQEDLLGFEESIDNAKAALMRVYDRAESRDDGRRMSMALRVRDLLLDGNRVMRQIVQQE